MPEAQSLDDNPLLKPLRSERGRRVVGLVAAVLIEAILLIVLLTLNIHDEPAPAPGSLTVVDLERQDDQTDDSEQAEQAEQEPSERAPTPEQPADPSEPQVDRPEVVQREVAPAPPMPEPIITTPFQLPAPKQAPRPAEPAAPKQVYGPVDSGSRSGSRDSEVVGTAPDGQPLYAARWYREPDDSELAGYLSTVNGPGWGLIACKTAPEFRVIDCVPIAEYPQGSMMNRAILAAAWQFRVRPPVRGGKSLVGSWVRIRIDYTTR